MLASRSALSALGWLPLIALVLLSAGCASLETPPYADRIQTTLPAPEAKVRAAVVQVLQEEGYRVNGAEEGARVLTTGYRQETDNPADWMLRSRFGTGRSHVEVTFAAEGDTATRLTIAVTYEGKDAVLESWKPYPAPLPQSAENQLRLVKNALGLL